MNLDNYLNMLTNVYAGGTNNHPEHNSNPHYWSVLLRQLIVNPEKFTNGKFLDFGCGKGRNVINSHYLVQWESADGVDISSNNIDFCNKTYSSFKSKFYLNNGSDLNFIPDNNYDFVMSTIVLQHICVHELRYKLLKEIYRVMKPGAVFSFQMGYGDMTYIKDAHITNYFDNNYNALNSNGTFDVRVSNGDVLISDLDAIGFIDCSYEIASSWADGGHLQWIYVEAIK